MTRGSSASTNLYVLELHSKTESSGSRPRLLGGPYRCYGGHSWHIHKKSGPRHSVGGRAWPPQARPSRRACSGSIQSGLPSSSRN
ncbi:Hypothetical protein FKW44_019069 [Caligus rogercresseyi]|uniref:Uncharacterized protein n=1 Tax=Caligus rogercresseyi TaxID=217165 RepID=A0A7T8GVB5_CALRO|nr:Hypothetical protein FKW44_019069 [Caligus rogercresseyi]